MICKSKKKSNAKGQIQMKQLELDQLLQTPLISQGFSGKYPTKSGKLQLPKEFAKDSSDSAIQSLAKNEEKTKQILKSSNKKRMKPKRKSKNKKSL